MMKEIQLTQGKVTLVDDEDYKHLNQWKWYAHKGTKTFYVVRYTNINGKQEIIYMHRIIMNTLNNQEVDHKDHNGLNNQKYNLRNCTKTQNQANKKKRINCSSKYKGVCWHNFAQKWQSLIKINYTQKHLGYYASELEAALAYNKVAKELFGDFALLNEVII